MQHRMLKIVEKRWLIPASHQKINGQAWALAATGPVAASPDPAAVKPPHGQRDHLVLTKHTPAKTLVPHPPPCPLFARALRPMPWSAPAYNPAAFLAAAVNPLTTNWWEWSTSSRTRAAGSEPSKITVFQCFLFI
ncbi:MAG: hypothetical protein JWL81_1605 [Verrucomicrobiales bacterium]|nr:hypothetical protein [Verrucomicrobiales bacterium]